MTVVTLNLPDELAGRLSALPDRDAYAASTLAAGLSDADADIDDDMSENERAAVRAGLQRGLSDSTEGRVKSTAQVYARLATEHYVIW